ncbi:ornithine cyclodeaminase/alanine dehydrogenase-like protein (mu-crystallin family) [Pullulanibacillus pueri]|uniref:Ornithine cyclodeaminase n=1 Tax=Pullulanibacillus pueri TaxID=1437324 RepID=A0A8J3A1J3_9BACL|nr:ornithine cyclodeaminase family protein [Pullulanibacillus pueri]MBM7684087.1 ornithine cyclodeaminase/alanine dehydrogenase-like protein (mu-crystallin family) [Pullulanibacillus pueri]GGH88615.1 ornithine cyclodeaminase [Pullulanibacillus pueri]
MALYLSENDVTTLLSMEEAIKAVEYGLKEFANKRAQNQPRNRVVVGSTTLNVMSSSMTEQKILGVKNYTTTPKGPNAYFLLFSEEGELLCLMEADELGRIRTGATTALATKWLSKADANTVTLIGTGFQAETQLKAICEVRNIEQIKVWSRRQESIQSFCKQLQSEVQAELLPVSDIEKAVQGSDIITTVTSATEPVLKGEWISEGAHINAVGNNRINEREIDSRAVKVADVIITDSIEQSKNESGDLVLAVAEGVEVWNRIKNLSDLLIGSVKGRESEDQVTLFKSNGLAIEDISVAYYVYKKAMNSGVGKEMKI